jgi:hypothetical protein
MRSLEIFKVGADAVNEFEYQKNQGELTEQREHHLEQQESPSGPATEAERIEQVIADAHAKVEERKRKGSGNVGRKKSAAPKSATKKSGGKKPAARSPARKTAAKKSTTKNSAKKSAAKKSAGKKSAAKKSAGKKSAAKKSAGKRSAARKR